MMHTELLCPAGDREALRAALHFGADAVYCGGPLLQLRARSAAFSWDNMREAVALVHAQGKRIYVTVNSFANNGEIALVGDYARELNAIGVDAAIVADLGVLTAVKEAAPDLDVHISTQANCCNYMAARTYYNMGASRVVLAREMRLADIAELRQKTPAGLELEAFVHGAMCMAYSGRCLISSFMNNRSGNRGECTQPCRWNYYLVEQKRPDEAFLLEESAEGTAILSSHDLNCLSFLDEMREAGVDSFKIEGRMKTAYYVATVTNAYRRRIDGSAPVEALERELLCASHRPYSRGFYFGEMGKSHFNDGVYRQNCSFAGVVKACENGRVTVEQRNAFFAGDELEVVSPRLFGAAFRVENLVNAQGEAADAATLVQERVTMDCPFALEEGDMLRKRMHDYDR